MIRKSVNEVLDNKGVCNCPDAEIQYLLGVSETNEVINVKTGLCLRCNGTRLSKKNFKILRSKRFQ